jgi:hypothetical protein
VPRQQSTIEVEEAMKRYRGPRLRSKGYKRPSKWKLLRAAMCEPISMACEEMLELISTPNNFFAELP